MAVMDRKTDQFRTSRCYTPHLNTLLREPGAGPSRELPSLEHLHSFYHLSQVVPFLWLVLLWSKYVALQAFVSLLDPPIPVPPSTVPRKAASQGEACEASYPCGGVLLHHIRLEVGDAGNSCQTDSLKGRGEEDIVESNHPPSLALSPPGEGDAQPGPPQCAQVHWCAVQGQEAEPADRVH